MYSVVCAVSGKSFTDLSPPPVWNIEGTMDPSQGINIFSKARMVEIVKPSKSRRQAACREV